MPSSRGITIACSTAKSPDFMRRYKQHLLRTVGLSQVEILFQYNPGLYSLASVYNQFLQKSKFSIVCLIHDDLIFPRNRQWGKYLLKAFQRYPDFAILGAAGSLVLEPHGIAWKPEHKRVGRLWHLHPETGKRYLSNFSENFEGLVLEALTLDGLFLAIHRARLGVGFDEELSGYHYYDVQLTLDQWLLRKNQLNSFRNGVLTNLGLLHLSTGSVNLEFEKYRRQFRTKYLDKLPLNQTVSLFQTAKKSPSSPLKVAILLFSLFPDLSLEPCLEVLPHVHASGAQLFLVSFFKQSLSAQECSWPLEQVSLKNTCFDLHQALAEVLPQIQLEAFDAVLVWDSRIIPESAAFDRLLGFFKDYHLPLGTLGIRLHYSDLSVYFSGLDMQVDLSGQIHCLFHGIHSAYRHYIKPQPTPYNHLGFCLFSAKLCQDPLDLSGGQDWIPGLEFNFACLQQGRFNYILADTTGLYRESAWELSLHPKTLEFRFQRFQVILNQWIQNNLDASSVLAWVRGSRFPLGS
ncbi:hypothetical protein COW36_00505 [bacterium (Candidatus Blackallbacteria) CG17_big_fil_post_rev_8_21_14_2_50_48_46]|uniref:Streptomycin biosynthesis protein StrF domain-containing protein n=1 Tax=bacterium (Candidatus Blackallbacteria) CG17_big_fil_post_rev_8_21_14_2_50_48_46 TaxID=2014261 RepID=A0A2M7GBN5_9BACT|nr:MAG: hypothetical protein COW64_10670 [bacterium (Candidatus Blackallbacteria) CG18_big_fil_WC_8_21_14_2_50_49_26]PIW19353.1 MAG: hypothetical protein COW36_00505 [bacterium (Candidatus Blackallbacteria) CG17_big_fil_post_rev_8_21_14_2_50_48_46]PIW49043.1 MAG: hypothetical protein COW20_07950 [bacterium (Candidatus Blackallbacteria) CG13_big_fil_rev_8_21_14_2_50_49_14]